ncbi:hypothetical protein J1614_006926 [Plenodomus biglobosus]|nr:hypothetical protein J1614_006926 [Plenodomus biglobosus]
MMRICLVGASPQAAERPPEKVRLVLGCTATRRLPSSWGTIALQCPAQPRPIHPHPTLPSLAIYTHYPAFYPNIEIIQIEPDWRSGNA